MAVMKTLNDCRRGATVYKFFRRNRVGLPWVSNCSSSGGGWEPDEVPAVGDPPHKIHIRRGYSVLTSKRALASAVQRGVAACRVVVGLENSAGFRSRSRAFQTMQDIERIKPARERPDPSNTRKAWQRRSFFLAFIPIGLVTTDSRLSWRQRRCLRHPLMSTGKALQEFTIDLVCLNTDRVS